MYLYMFMYMYMYDLQFSKTFKLLLKYHFWEIDFFTAVIKITYGILLAEEIGG